MKGIDVSVSQGKIDWEKVKSEVDFAILRCGYGSDIAEQDDKQWLYNVAECERLGIPWGVYLYSYAMSLDEADSEAAHVLRLLKGRKPALPVYLDMEDADGYKAKRGGISRSLATDICVRFCEKIKAAGYIPGVYANLDWTRNHLDMDRLSGYEFWIAQYNDVCTYTGSYGLWQYTSKGRIDGVSGNVDMNIMYKDYLKPRANVSWIRRRSRFPWAASIPRCVRCEIPRCLPSGRQIRRLSPLCAIRRAMYPSAARRVIYIPSGRSLPARRASLPLLTAIPRLSL